MSDAEKRFFSGKPEEDAVGGNAPPLPSRSPSSWKGTTG